jgi:hypothetical protein
MGPRQGTAWRALSLAVALLGWSHLASPWGPDFRQTVAGRAARVSAPSQAGEAGGDERRRRESRLRRALLGNGYRLMRTRLRQVPEHLGGYLVVEFDSGRVVIGGEPRPFAARLEEVEAWYRREGPGGSAEV